MAAAAVWRRGAQRWPAERSIGAASRRLRRPSAAAPCSAPVGGGRPPPAARPAAAQRRAAVSARAGGRGGARVAHAAACIVLCVSRALAQLERRDDEVALVVEWLKAKVGSDPRMRRLFAAALRAKRHDLTALVAGLSLIRAPRGTVVYRQGEHSEDPSFYVVANGGCEVWHRPVAEAPEATDAFSKTGGRSGQQLEDDAELGRLGSRMGSIHPGGVVGERAGDRDASLISVGVLGADGRLGPTDLLCVNRRAFCKTGGRVLNAMQSAIESRVKFLRRQWIFAGVPDEELAYLAYFMTEHAIGGTLPECIFDVTDNVDAVHFVVEGSVALSRTAIDAKLTQFSLTMEHVRAPMYFGAYDLLDGKKKRSKRAETVQPSVLSSVPARIFFELFLTERAAKTYTVRERMLAIKKQRTAWYDVRNDEADTQVQGLSYAFLEAVQEEFIAHPLTGEVGTYDEEQDNDWMALSPKHADSNGAPAAAAAAAKGGAGGSRRHSVTTTTAPVRKLSGDADDVATPATITVAGRTIQVGRIAARRAVDGGAPSPAVRSRADLRTPRANIVAAVPHSLDVDSDTRSVASFASSLEATGTGGSRRGTRHSVHASPSASSIDLPDEFAAQVTGDEAVGTPTPHLMSGAQLVAQRSLRKMGGASSTGRLPQVSPISTPGSGRSGSVVGGMDEDWNAAEGAATPRTAMLQKSDAERAAAADEEKRVRQRATADIMAVLRAVSAFKRLLARKRMKDPTKFALGREARAAAAKSAAAESPPKTPKLEPIRGEIVAGTGSKKSQRLERYASRRRNLAPHREGRLAGTLPNHQKARSKLGGEKTLRSVKSVSPGTMTAARRRRRRTLGADDSSTGGGLRTPGSFYGTATTTSLKQARINAQRAISKIDAEYAGLLPSTRKALEQADAADIAGAGLRGSQSASALQPTARSTRLSGASSKSPTLEPIGEAAAGKAGGVRFDLSAADESTVPDGSASKSKVVLDPVKSTFLERALDSVGSGKAIAHPSTEAITSAAARSPALAPLEHRPEFSLSKSGATMLGIGGSPRISEQDARPRRRSASSARL